MIPMTFRNIEVSPEDGEILAIGLMEQALGEIPEPIATIRSLITRFESCHFKAEKHFGHIIASIAALEPAIRPERIGSNHPRQGEKAVAQDSTGRSRAGQEYIAALELWLGETRAGEQHPGEMLERVTEWLGEKNDAKKRLVVLLLDRLLYRSLERYTDISRWDALEYQIMATDICNYRFPRNVEAVIQGIGRQEAVRDFHGCGTSDPDVVTLISKHFQGLCRWLEGDESEAGRLLGKKDPVKVWLVSCLAKTMKEQISLSAPVPGLSQEEK